MDLRKPVAVCHINLRCRLPEQGAEQQPFREFWPVIKGVVVAEYRLANSIATLPQHALNLAKTVENFCDVRSGKFLNCLSMGKNVQVNLITSFGLQRPPYAQIVQQAPIVRKLAARAKDAGMQHRHKAVRKRKSLFFSSVRRFPFATRRS